jgi:hypothetical protein
MREIGIGSTTRRSRPQADLGCPERGKVVRRPIGTPANVVPVHSLTSRATGPPGNLSCRKDLV